MSGISNRSLRSRTPKKVSENHYDSIISSQIGRERRSTRIKSESNDKTPSKPTNKHLSKTTTSPKSSTSNVENEEAQEENESTPRSNLSRNRNRRTIRRSRSSSTYEYKTSINEEKQTVKAVIRVSKDSRSESKSESRRSESKSESRKLRPRKSVFNNTTLFDISSSLSSEEDEDTTPIRNRNKGSYFTKADNDDFVPEESEASTDSEVNVDNVDNDNNDEDDSSNDDDNGNNGNESQESTADDNDCSSDDETENECQPTKQHHLLKTSLLAKIAVTPEILKKVEGRFIKRRIAVDSPASIANQTMSPNPELYFLAENRIKYKRMSKLPEAMNDAMKGKRRKQRKVKQSESSKLPDRPRGDFSVTAEAIKAKASIDPAKFIEGSTHDKEVEEILKNIVENEFPKWLGLFRDRFNVMMYGYGSKLEVFKEFELFVNGQYLVVSINGLFPKLNARKFLHGMCEHVRPGKVPHNTSLEVVAKETYDLLKDESHSDIFLLVNNFDSMALRHPQMLTALCWLSQVSYIHILASCDTVNAFLGVTQSQALQLKFFWVHCATFVQYRQELNWIPGIYGDENKAVTQKGSLKYIIQSLTGNAKKAFAVLSQLQIKQMKSRAVQKSKEAYAGVRFQELAKECREKFIAHSDENLRTLLVEFFDHKLIRQTGKGRHLETTLLIELDLQTLEEILTDLV